MLRSTVKKIAFKWWLIIILYLYFFSPPFKFFSLGFDKVVLIWSICYINYKHEWSKIGKLFNRELSIWKLIILYCIFIFLIHSFFTTIFLLYDIIFIIEVFTVPYAIILYFYDKQKIKIDKCVLISCIIAGGISTYLLLNPDLAYNIKSDLFRYSETALKNFSWRGFGLSDGLLFAYPIVEGTAIGLIILGVTQRYKTNWIYALSCFIMLLAIIPNARTGFVPILIAIFIMFFYSQKRLITISLVVVGIILMSSVAINEFISENEGIDKTVEWSLTSIEIADDFFHGEKTENVEALSSSMIIWPNDIFEWMLGSGVDLSTVKNGSDIGYIVRLNYGGIIYLLLIFSFIMILFKRLWKFNQELALLLIMTLLVANFKGDFFLNNPLTRFIMFIYTAIIMNRNLFTLPR